MEQLGFLQELKEISKPATGYNIFKETSDGHDLVSIGGLDVSVQKSFTGYHAMIMHGSELHALLLSKVPRHKIHFGKRVLSISQEDDDSVMIRTSDGAGYQGEILVGSDGTYSAVRQSLYKNLTKEGVLPSSDAEDLKVSHLSYCGTTDPIDSAIAPCIADEFSHCDVIIGHNKPETSEAFRNTEWSSEASKSMDESWNAFKVPLGPNGGYLTLGDLIKATPDEQISKIVLEEKLFITWYNRRTVLLGDACHKMLPNAGKAIVNAMLDAVVLANELYEIIDDASNKNILSAFKEYYKVRYPYAKTDFEISQRTARLIAGQSKTEVMVRKAVYSFGVTLLKPKANPKIMAYRPQASFLPKIGNHGEGCLDPQKESKRYQQMMAAAI
ncbi:hypothetical protein BGX27_009595 [Mortierella sp. AM989]|nr:hypothetical protein BGX27_009595 [Mortierella sp. AM989]